MKELRDNIIVIIEEKWPVSVTEIAFHLGLFRKGMNEKKRKAAIGKVIYHIKKLKEINKINTKKIGQTVIIWPTEIEKLRVMNELMK
jgi:predicted transcriptional regulator